MEINNFPLSDANCFLQKYQESGNRDNSYLDHPYYVYIIKEPNFIRARTELESKGVIPAFENENDEREYWLEFIIVLTSIFVTYFENALDKGCTIKAKPVTKGARKKIEKHAGKLIDLLNGSGLFPEYSKNHHLIDLLIELREAAIKGQSPAHTLSRIDEKNLPREMLLKLLITRCYVQYQELYPDVTCSLVSIVDDSINERTVQRYVSKLHDEVELNRKWIEENLINIFKEID
ncbi:MAG: hypothetical protein ACH255_13490 [Candidatus Thiodiazotropha sp.]